MNGPEVNIPLLRKAVEWAEAEAAKPEEFCEWEQGYYVVPLTRDDPLARTQSEIETGKIDGWDWVAQARRDKAETCGTCYCIAGYAASLSGRDWNYSTAEEVGRAELGLSARDTDALFAAGNTIADVRRIAEDIAGERL